MGSVCVPDSDQSDVYSPHFQLSLIQHGKICHSNAVKNSNTSLRTTIGHAHSFNTEPAAQQCFVILSHQLQMSSVTWRSLGRSSDRAWSRPWRTRSAERSSKYSSKHRCSRQLSGLPFIALSGGGRNAFS